MSEPGSCVGPSVRTTAGAGRVGQVVWIVGETGIAGRPRFPIWSPQIPIRVQRSSNVTDRDEGPEIPPLFSTPVDACRVDPRPGDPETTRLMVVDDMPTIHADFRRVFAIHDDAQEDRLQELAPWLPQLSPSDQTPPRSERRYEIEAFTQGEPARDRLRDAIARGERYAVAFVDMRMPPGWDGIRTARELWAVDPGLEIVICCAYSDLSWEQIKAALGNNLRLTCVAKPFDVAELARLTADLCARRETPRGASSDRIHAA